MSKELERGMTGSRETNWSVHAKSLQSCLTLCDPVDCNLPGSSVHGIFQARILEWVAMPSFWGSSQPRDWTYVSYVSCIGRWVLHHWHHLGTDGGLKQGSGSKNEELLIGLKDILEVEGQDLAICYEKERGIRLVEWVTVKGNKSKRMQFFKLLTAFFNDRMMINSVLQTQSLTEAYMWDY